MSVDLGDSHFDNMEGIYVIWQAGGSYIYTGQGKIKDALARHRQEKAVVQYGNLRVTWAPVTVQYRDGIERYLANVLKPKVGDVFPNVAPIAVNLP